jgi:hypothetical protein
LRALVDADPIVGPQIDRLVGTPFHRSQLQWGSFIEGRVLIPLVEASGGFVFDEEAFGVVIDPILDALYAAEVAELYLVPLFGLELACDSIELAPNVTLVQMDDETLSRCLALNVLPDERDMFDHVRLANSDQCALTHEARWPKIVGDIDPEQLPQRLPLGEMADRLVTALRLVVGGDVHRGSLVHLSLPTTHGGEGASYERRPVTTGLTGTPTVVRPDDVIVVRDTFVRLESSRVRKDRALTLALRRFSQATLRPDKEDTLLDLMIAAEALFLGGPASDRGELRFRLALNAALAAGRTPLLPSQVRKFIRRAYDARSAVAHGDEPKKLYSLSGELCGLSALTVDLDFVLRTILCEVVRLEADGRGFRDWDTPLDSLLDVRRPSATE